MSSIILTDQTRTNGKRYSYRHPDEPAKVQQYIDMCALQGQLIAVPDINNDGDYIYLNPERVFVIHRANEE